MTNFPPSPFLNYYSQENSFTVTDKIFDIIESMPGVLATSAVMTEIHSINDEWHLNDDIG